MEAAQFIRKMNRQRQARMARLAARQKKMEKKWNHKLEITGRKIHFGFEPRSSIEKKSFRIRDKQIYRDHRGYNKNPSKVSALLTVRIHTELKKPAFTERSTNLRCPAEEADRARKEFQDQR